MKIITLAYCSENENLALQMESDLKIAGLRFEHLTETKGPFAEQLRRVQGPVLLILTSNLFRQEACMTGLLPVVQELLHRPGAVVTVADGRELRADGSGYDPAPTNIERMASALQFLNFWQNRYLELIGRERDLNDAARREMQPEMQRIHNIANEIGELLVALRETMYFNWQQLTGGDYKLFFQQFDLADLHTDYVRNKSHKSEDTAPHLAPPPGGPVAFVPAEAAPAAPEPEVDKIAIPAPEYIPAPEHKETIDPNAGREPLNEEVEIRQTIKDAWLWLENGQTERGLQVFQLALEQHPLHQNLRTEYLLALSRHARSPEAAERQLEILHDSGLEEAKSYDLMGEIAQSKGDFLFAKYCWDRVLQIAPGTPGIYRKLGILTSAHLPDYRETGIHYLKLALEENPNDPILPARLEQLLSLLSSAVQTPAAESIADTPEHAEPEAEQEAQPTAVTPAVQEPEMPARENILTVLITGATSGIGKATAFEFARHGHRLILTGRRAERLAELQQQIEEQYRTEVLPLCFDVRDAAGVQQHLDNLPEPWREVDVLINNAGLAKGLSPIHEGSLLHWETMIDTNLKGLLYVTRCIAPGMVSRRKGFIVNIASSAGKEVYPNGNVYCATKFGVDALTRAMRYDLHQYNIRVGQVAPGHVEETEFAITRFDGDAEKARIYDNFQPLKSSDVAETIYFMVTRPPHVNIQDILMFGTQQAASMLIDRSGRT